MQPRVTLCKLNLSSKKSYTSPEKDDWEDDDYFKNDDVFNSPAAKNMIELHNLKTSNPKNSKVISDNEKNLICKQTTDQGTKKISSGFNFLKNFLKEKTGKVVCDQCVQFFDNESALQEHYKIAHPKHPNRKYPCKICPIVYCKRETLAKHTKEIHDQIFDDGEAPLFSCEFCEDLFLTSHKLYDHIRTVHRDSRPCKIQGCGKVFTNNFELRRHKQNKHGIMPPIISKKDKVQEVICEECGIIKSSQKSLECHIRYHHHHRQKSYTISCDKCGKKLSNMDSLRSHMKSVHEKAPCEICGKKISSGRMKSHVFNLHPTGDEEFPYICKICGKGFFENYALKNHSNIHTGEKPFKCEYCGLGFAHPRNRRAHEQSIHHGIKRIHKNKSENTNPELL